MLPKLPPLQCGPLTFSEERPRKSGQGFIHRARLADGREVAVKVARPEPWRVRGTEAEARALSAIHERDPTAKMWLVDVLATGVTADGMPFLVLPWFQWNLAEWLMIEHPGLSRRLHALVQAAAAVVRLHQSGSELAEVPVHRDIKPPNYLVNTNESRLHVVLADLGGIKERVLLGSTQHTRLFSEHYAPPEQVLPLRRRHDPSVDVYALAVTVFEALVGSFPQSTRLRNGAWNQHAKELDRLALSKLHHTPEQAARFEELQRWPTERFLDLEDHRPLFDEDERRLVVACQALSATDQGQRIGIGSDVAQTLLPPLRRALQLDYSARPQMAHELLAGLEHAVVLAGEAPARGPTRAPGQASNRAALPTPPPDAESTLALPTSASTLAPQGNEPEPGADGTDTFATWDPPEPGDTATPSTQLPAGPTREGGRTWTAGPATLVVMASLVGAGGLFYGVATRGDAASVQASIDSAFPASTGASAASPAVSEPEAPTALAPSIVPANGEVAPDPTSLATVIATTAPDTPNSVPKAAPTPVVNSTASNGTTEAPPYPEPFDLTFEYLPDVEAIVRSGGSSSRKRLEIGVDDESRLVQVEPSLGGQSLEYEVSANPESSGWTARVVGPRGEMLEFHVEEHASVTVRVSESGALERR